MSRGYDFARTQCNIVCSVRCLDGEQRHLERLSKVQRKYGIFTGGFQRHAAFVITLHDPLRISVCKRAMQAHFPVGQRRGVVIMGALPSASLTLVPAALAALRSHFPGLEARVMEAYNDELITMLRTNQVEFALATRLDEMSDMAFEPLVDDTFCVVFPPGHPISHLDCVTWKDLLAYELVLLSHGSSARSQFDKAVRTESPPTLLHYDITHMTTAVVLVKQGLGIAVLPKLPLNALPMATLRYKPLCDATAQRSIGILYRRDRHLSPGSRAFIQKVKDVVAAMKDCPTTQPSSSVSITRA